MKIVGNLLLEKNLIMVCGLCNTGKMSFIVAKDHLFQMFVFFEKKARQRVAFLDLCIYRKVEWKSL